ncbi:hypothetical protein [Maribacter sp. 2307UL18-2]|uniref:hypothetical protein n=1 Tax=Maribacter sp. 2307UL18-2 TaxID=3386274 RepID=UPI0039BC4A8F
MKKLSLLFLLPLMVFGQPKQDLEINYVSLEFRMEINTAFVFEDERHMERTRHQEIDLLVSLRVPLEYIDPYSRPKIQPKDNIPVHLTTFSLSSPALLNGATEAPQERLDRLLAMNDPEFPKENTLFKNLNAVRYSNSSLNGIETMQEWFGPKINL